MNLTFFDPGPPWVKNQKELKQLCTYMWTPISPPPSWTVEMIFIITSACLNKLKKQRRFNLKTKRFIISISKINFSSQGEKKSIASLRRQRLLQPRRLNWQIVNFARTGLPKMKNRSAIFRQPQDDQNKVGHLISQLQLGVYSESRMRISIKIVSRSRGWGSRRDFVNSLIYNFKLQPY